MTRVRLYRYRRPESGMFAMLTAGHARRIRLRDPEDESVWLELVWEEDDEQPPELPHDLAQGTIELIPGTLMPAGTTLESEEVWEEHDLSLAKRRWREHVARHAFEREMSLAMLGRALAERVAPLVPDAFRADLVTTWINDHSRWVFEMQPEFGGAEMLAEAARRALDQLQDDIAETTHERWPAVGRGILPTPDCEQRDGALHVWFGRRDDPVLALDPIPLRELCT